MKGARAVTSFVFYHTRLYVSNGPAVELNIVFLTESATYFGYVLVLLTCWLRLSSSAGTWNLHMLGYKFPRAYGTCALSTTSLNTSCPSPPKPG